jgi:hypothetical protein
MKKPLSRLAPGILIHSAPDLARKTNPRSGPGREANYACKLFRAYTRYNDH